jgi:hypothetical protein
MTDELLDYALDQLPPDERAAVEARVATDPVLAAKLSRLQSALAPLAADRDPDDPPAELATNAIARTANFLVENGLFTAAAGFVVPGEPTVRVNPPAREARWLPISRAHANAAVAAGILLVVSALGIVGIQKARHGYQTLVCQNNMRELHAALSGYSEVHNGWFPQTGSAAVPVAGAFVDELDRTGQPTPTAARICPLGYPAKGVGYAYSLGFTDPFGRVTGLRKPDSADDHTPILADLPADGNTRSLHGGWNVLTVGGSVRFTTTSAVGPDQDDIFRNTAGLRRAGLHRDDVCLGSPLDRP